MREREVFSGKHERELNGHGHAEDDEALRPFLEWKYKNDESVSE